MQQVNITRRKIIAISIINAGELFPPHKIRIRPGKCISYISAPFETSELNLDDINTLRDSIKEDIYRNLKNHYPVLKSMLFQDPLKLVHINLIAKQ